jgi:hypothetical protein
MSRTVRKSTVDRTESLVREYLSRNDNGRGEAYFKASDIAEGQEEMTPRRAGRGLAEIENRNMDDVAIERWGKSRSTQWRVFYTDS